MLWIYLFYFKEFKIIHRAEIVKYQCEKLGYVKPVDCNRSILAQ